jgi:hypothetical protein
VRVLVTHQLQFMRECDVIAVLAPNGTMAELGTLVAKCLGMPFLLLIVLLSDTKSCSRAAAASTPRHRGRRTMQLPAQKRCDADADKMIREMAWC